MAGYQSYFSGNTGSGAVTEKSGKKGYSSYFGGTTVQQKSSGDIAKDRAAKQLADEERKRREREQQKRQQEQARANSFSGKVKSAAKAVYEGATEASKYSGKGAGYGVGSGQKGAREAQSKAQDSNTAVIKRASDKLRDPNTSKPEKDRWEKLLQKAVKSGSDLHKDIRQNQKEFTEATDPTRQGAAAASMAFDVATLGVGTAGAQAVKQAAKAGGKKAAAKVLLKDSAKTAATAAPSGAASPVIEKGKDATAKDIVTGAAVAGGIGGAFPGAGYVAGEVVSKVAGKIRPKKSVAPAPAPPAVDPDAPDLPKPGMIVNPNNAPNSVPQAILDEMNQRKAAQQADEAEPEHPATATVREHFEKAYKAASDHPDETFAADYIRNNIDKAIKDYEERTVQIYGSRNFVGGDDAKYSIPGMEASKSDPYHEPGSQLAKGYFRYLLDDPATTHKPVLITAGGTGAGKTSALKKEFTEDGIDPNDYAAIIDTNLGSYEAAMSRITPSLESGRSVQVKFVYRDPLEAFENGVIPRAVKENRAVTAEAHAETHGGSLETIKELGEKFKDDENVDILIVDNSRGAGNSVSVPLDFLHDKVYTKNEIEVKIHELLDHQLREGKLTNEQHTTFTGGRSAPQPEPKPTEAADGLGEAGPDVPRVEPGPEPQVRTEPEPQRQKGPVEPSDEAFDLSKELLDYDTAITGKPFKRIETPEPKKLSPEEDWEQNYADRTVELDGESFQLRQDLKTAKVKEKPPLQAKIKELESESAALEDEWLKKHGQEPKPEPAKKTLLEKVVKKEAPKAPEPKTPAAASLPKQPPKLSTAKPESKSLPTKPEKLESARVPSKESVAEPAILHADIKDVRFTGLKKNTEFPNTYNPAKLEEVLHYPKLLADHPYLKDYTVKYASAWDMEPGRIATHDGKNKIITIERDAPENEKLSQLMHEVQHAIQKHEGRTAGASSSATLGHEGYRDNPLEVEARKAGDMFKNHKPVVKDAPNPISKPTPAPEAPKEAQIKPAEAPATLTPVQTAHMETVGGYTHSTHFETDYADMLRDRELTLKGGQIVKNPDGTYRRTSEHSRFYRDYFKEHGRAPNKAAYLEEAQRQLAGGKADFGASDDWKVLVEREHRPIPRMELDLPKTGTGPTAPSRLAQGIERGAIRAKLTKSFGDLPEYSQVNMADQAERAAKLLSEDAQKANRIALGLENPEGDLLPESVLVAVENKAIADGDVDLLRKLAHGTRAGEASAMGQRIRALAERDPESVVGAIRSVQKARAEMFKKRAGKTPDKAIAEEVKAIQAAKPKVTTASWSSFIDSLKC